MENIKKLRNEYKNIARRSLAGSISEFNAAVAALNPQLPEEYLAAARKVEFWCGACAGTGKFVKSVDENGIPHCVNNSVCFRCAGKGAQNDADRRRNFGYDQRNPTGGIDARFNKKEIETQQQKNQEFLDSITLEEQIRYNIY